MSAYVFYIKQNTRRPNLVARLKNADKTPLDLSDAVSVKFTMNTEPHNNPPKIDSIDATIVDAPNGVVQYEWQDGDTDTLGTFRGEFTVDWGSGIFQTLPEDDYIKVVVKDDLQ